MNAKCMNDHFASPSYAAAAVALVLTVWACSGCENRADSSATAPATQPNTRPARSDGAAPTFAVAAVGKPQDAARFIIEADRVVIEITSPSGIGSVTIDRQGGPWPANVIVRLRYTAGRPFARIEGLDCTVGSPAGVAQRLQPRIVKQNELVEAQIALPPSAAQHTRMTLEWVDAYR
jgi:hypothetical protein